MSAKTFMTALSPPAFHWCHWHVLANPRRRQRRMPTLDVTSWTDKSELFMEHPPLVAGQTVRFAVHLTKLARLQRAECRPPAHRDDAGSRAAPR